MASNQNFRSAFNGYNKEDVVHYLDYLNGKYTRQIDLLTAENESLQQLVASLPDLELQCKELTRQLEESQARCAALEQAQHHNPAPVSPAAPLSSSAQDELEAYRRAERIEREARVRAERVHAHAADVLTEASDKVDGISAGISEMADQVAAQVARFQEAIQASKTSLQEAFDLLETLRPEK